MLLTITIATPLLLITLPIVVPPFIFIPRDPLLQLELDEGAAFLDSEEATVVANAR